MENEQRLLDKLDVIKKELPLKYKAIVILIEALENEKQIEE